MWQIFIGSLVLSVIHTLIPNHWIPLIAIGKTEKWSLKETLAATIITGFSHTLSTILIGILVGIIGIKLSANYSFIMSYVAPAILATIGTVYLIFHFTRHDHHHTETKIIDKDDKTKSRTTILTSLSIAMFLTPCVEIEAYYFQAGMIGWKGILVVSAVYLFTTLILMFLLVYAGFKGTQRIRSQMLEHNEKLITGIVLILLGLLAFFAY